MIRPFDLSIDQADLDVLSRRLSEVRWPEKETVDDWSQGVPLAQAKELCDYWCNTYDWRRCERMLNGWGQFKTEIDGLDIHFLHIKSHEPDALPLLLTHGWPGSIIEFAKVIGPLTDPAAHGGKASDAFDLVIPSIPGYGFSGRPGDQSWGVDHIASAWITLMRRLGYRRFVAQGGDWGSAITTELAIQRPPECVAIHLNMPLAFPPPPDTPGLTPEEVKAAQDHIDFVTTGTGYSLLQGTRPQTIGYALVDSPMGQATWIYEKFKAWADCAETPQASFGWDALLDNIMLYWLMGNGASAGRLYWQSAHASFTDTRKVTLPTGCSIFPREMLRPSRRMVAERYTNLVYWNELPCGGHFAAMEQPGLFVDEMRTYFRQFR
ncbi:epoxide hydrolase family protein [Novosphingobium rosa]|uniref:epoxide hydrolase family protein n=1 Tax=Novosphingobium rosa TaxID=76978 RepID=UPI000836297F|nr:epoxide hydrolase family protein [Novosphingobium rosa]